MQGPQFLSAEQVLLTTLVVKLAVMAALSTMLVRYRRFRHILIFEKRAWPDRLTKRELQVLQLIAKGKTNKEIASILHLSVKTVEFHRVRLMQKLRVHTAAELAVAALRNHLVVESEAPTIAGQMLDKRALEGLWHARLAEVKLRFDEASVHVKDIQNRFGTDVSSDGALALVQALREQNRILAEYNRVLRIYNDLTVYGRAPDEI